MERGHAEALFPLIDAALTRAGASYGDLTHIAVCTGPGSFTGIRVGVAAARGLALGLGVPAIGITRFDALLAAAGADAPSTVLVPGRGATAYVQDFSAAQVAEGAPR
jgi:tRNA threonylcarbamoyl adenosine modification protein YeaZ